MNEVMAKNSPLYLIALSITGITILSAFFLSSTKVSAEVEHVNASVIVPEACTMSGSGMNSHTATLSPGTFSGNTTDYSNGIGKTTFSVVCNDYNGFSIYAIGFTGDSYDSTNHTKLVGSNTGGTINTAVYANGNTTSSWSMKVNKVTDTSVSYNPANMSIQNSFDDWHAVPATYTKVAQYHATTGSSSTDTTLGAKVETTYSAFIATNQPADTYIGQVKYTMVHPYNEAPPQAMTCASGYICYFPNTNIVEGTMGRQSISTSATNVTLIPSNYNKTGYGFAGWSDAYDYATNTDAHFYGPQEAITFTAGQYTGSNPGLSLYAIWIKSAGNLQDSDVVNELCGASASSLTAASTSGIRTLASVSALTDQRDNQTYAIARLSDGKCWIIENLRLDNSAILTISNTNNPLNNDANVTLKHNYSDTTTYNTLSATSSVAYDAITAPDGWCTTYDADCVDQSRIRTDNTANRATYNNTDNMSSKNNIFSYGNYYNWYSATAGRGTYDFISYNENTIGDLCPNGWYLPSGGNKTNEANSDYWELVVNGINNGVNPANYDDVSYPYYSGSEAELVYAKLRTYPNNFVYSGHVYGGSISDRGYDGSGSSTGYYWSSTSAGNDGGSSAYYFRFGYQYVLRPTVRQYWEVRPGNLSVRKSSGYTIRCIAYTVY